MNLVKRKDLLGIVAATIVFIVVLYLADIEKVLSALFSADRAIFVVCIITGSLVLIIRSQVWAAIFEGLDMDISSFDSFLMFSGGEFLNNVTPLGQAGGQPFMAYVISDNSDMEYEESLAMVLSADIMTGFPLLSFGLISGGYLIYTGIAYQYAGRIAVSSAVIILLGSVIVYLLWFRSGTIEDRIFWLCERVIPSERLIEKIESWLENIEQTFEKIGDEPRELIPPVIYAHMAFLFNIVTMFLAFYSIGVYVNPLYLFLVFPIANLSKSAPTSGGSGVYEVVLASIISLILGTAFATALAAAFIYRISTYWLAILIGYISISKLNYSGLTDP